MSVENVRRCSSMWSLYSTKKDNVPSSRHSVCSVWSLSEEKVKTRTGKKKPVRTKLVTYPPCVCGDVNSVDSKGRSLLFYSVRYGQVDPALQLIQAGCSIDQTDAHGNTPLHEALTQGNLDMANVLLKEGADVNIGGNDGQTPLLIAVSHGQIDTVRLLHKFGADVNTCDVNGQTPLYIALKGGWDEIANFLLDQQCDVNTTSANGMTCFFAAAHCHKLHLVAITRRLIKAGYDFRQDSEWLLTEGCPPIIQADSKMHDTILVRACLKERSNKKRSIIRSGSQKIIKTFRNLTR